MKVVFNGLKKKKVREKKVGVMDSIREGGGGANADLRSRAGTPPKN